MQADPAPRPHREAVKIGRDHIAMLADRQGLTREAAAIRAGRHDANAGVAEAIEAARDGYL